MGKNRNINDDSTLAYLFNKTRQGASDALEKAIESLKSLFVKKAGDTMTGALSFNPMEYPLTLKANAKWDDKPSSSVSTHLRFSDKDNEPIGFFRAFISKVTKNGTDHARTAFQMYSSCNGVTNTLNIRVDDDGERTIGVSDAAPWRDALNAVNKAGDTMTGALTSVGSVDNAQLIAKSATASKTTVPSAQTNPCGIALQDKNGSGYGWVRAYHDASNRIGFWMYGLNHASNSANALRLLFDSNDNPVVEFTNVGAWRTALGFNSVGALPIVLGGSGQTDASVTSTISNIATAGSNITIADASFAKWGEVGQIRLRLTASANIAAGSVVATIKTGKRPAVTTSLAEMNGKNTAWVSTSNPGQITINSAISSGGGVILQGTYIIGNS